VLRDHGPLSAEQLAAQLSTQAAPPQGPPSTAPWPSSPTPAPPRLTLKLGDGCFGRPPSIPC
jgi:hypothetical protein